MQSDLIPCLAPPRMKILSALSQLQARAQKGQGCDCVMSHVTVVDRARLRLAPSPLSTSLHPPLYTHGQSTYGGALVPEDLA